MADDNVEKEVATVIEAIRVLSGNPATEKQTFGIRKFLDEGLASNDLIDALNRAYTNTGVLDPWKYFCGICWRIISRTKRGSEGESVGSRGIFPWS